MELAKAKELLDSDLTYTYPARFTDLQTAMKLGSEAITYITRLRACSLEHRQNRLPSEDSFINTAPSEHPIKRILESPLATEPKET